MAFIVTVPCLCLALSVAACGQRGPLYLPDQEASKEEAAQQETQTQESTDELQEENDEEDA